MTTAERSCLVSTVVNAVSEDFVTRHAYGSNTYNKSSMVDVSASSDIAPYILLSFFN
ncbi:hypothetical protein KIN20_032144 [Parelaphostrongylus tenuis]|uniref:Uncharacterized protein n=1 Tax=Parelaphostrongylus tenuis TaxID=148309 RepID=A0AAD5R6K1_PARTN|nr:hypothetical protein KIN20_032144 [Parelaphostrongylus tenuis]